jgi:hypothetical protein
MWRRSEVKESDEEVHRKRVCQLLRYISTMQTSGSGQYSFVRAADPANQHQPFFQGMADVGGRVMCTTYDFQSLTAVLETIPSPSIPFSFYTTTSTTPRKRSALGSVKPEERSAPPCWLRLTRPTTEDPPIPCTTVTAYLRDWSEQRGVSIKQLLTFENLSRAPASNSQTVQRFLRQYKKYLRKQKLRLSLEPIYNHLFEWYQDSNNLDLIWGLGQARMKNGDEIMDGPLLEIRLEVELARDGALLVRPKQHTGVSLNRKVLAALTTNNRNDATARNLNQTVDELDTADLAPGEPSTYTSLLKRIAVEVSSGGTFQSSKSTSRQLSEKGQLVVTDAWCLYSSPRPSAVWARDALAFVETLSSTTCVDDPLPKALWALTHGPGALEETKEKDEKQSSSSAFGFLTAAFAKKIKDTPSISRPPFPLPTSDAQNRIADLLLTKNYPAVVCEGPPGTGKTHTIANIVCAYLSQGKRVLVTSKGAPALSVLRERLPRCVQELCVDVSMSESAGMRQLQQTVERLANKVSWVNTEREMERSEALQVRSESNHGIFLDVHDSFMRLYRLLR